MQAAPEKFPGFLVEELRMALKDLRDADGHRAVHEHPDMRDLLTRKQQVQVVEQVLGSFDGKGGDDDVAAGLPCLVDRFRQRAGDGRRILVFPVAVRGLHEHVVGFIQGRWVAQDRGVPASKVS